MAQYKRSKRSIKAYTGVLFHKGKGDVVSELTEAASSFCIGEEVEK